MFQPATNTESNLRNRRDKLQSNYETNLNRPRWTGRRRPKRSFELEPLGRWNLYYNMNLTIHELSIGLSLQRPISKQDLQRRDDWMERYIGEMFILAKEALVNREMERKAALVCHECATTGQHDTASCPFPHRHVPLFPELEA